jgi:hypothetical protein
MFRLPVIVNEPLVRVHFAAMTLTVQKNYAPGSEERVKLVEALKECAATVHEVPVVINGKSVRDRQNRN